jgi:hypothetical protein
VAFEKLDVNFTSTTDPSLELFMRSDVEECLWHDFRDAPADGFALGLRLDKSRLQRSLDESEPVGIGHTGTIGGKVCAFSQVKTGTVWHSGDPIKWSLFIGFLWLLKLLLKHLDESSLYLGEVVKIDLLTDQLLPDNARKIQDHLGTRSDTDAHEDAEEVIEVQVGRRRFI